MGAQSNLEQLAGQVVADMLAVVETKVRGGNTGSAFERLSTRLVVELFLQFADLFGQLKQASLPAATKAMEHYRGRLRGPPNAPTKDVSGLMTVVVDFLQSQLPPPVVVAEEDGGQKEGDDDDNNEAAAANESKADTAAPPLAAAAT